MEKRSAQTAGKMISWWMHLSTCRAWAGGRGGHTTVTGAMEGGGTSLRGENEDHLPLGVSVVAHSLAGRGASASVRARATLTCTVRLVSGSPDSSRKRRICPATSPVAGGRKTGSCAEMTSSCSPPSRALESACAPGTSADPGGRVREREMRGRRGAHGRDGMPKAGVAWGWRGVAWRGVGVGAPAAARGWRRSARAGRTAARCRRPRTAARPAERPRADDGWHVSPHSQGALPSPSRAIHLRSTPTQRRPISLLSPSRAIHLPRAGRATVISRAPRRRARASP